MAKRAGHGSRPAPEDAIQRVNRAVQARASGLTWRATADVAGYTDPSNCRRQVLKALSDNLAESVEQYRSLNQLRLERLLASQWAAALGGDPGAWERARAAVNDLSRLMGANMPTRVEVTDVLDAQIAALAEELAAVDTDISGVVEEEAR